MAHREKIRELTIQEIKSTARHLMEESGTAAVSLSAIARQMELSAPALYRYFASRDDLVTALIVDSYNNLADAMLSADQAQPQKAYFERLQAAILAYRQWAIDHPVDFQLIFGNPIPGYHAPFQVTAPIARRSLGVVLDILTAAYQAGHLNLPAEMLRFPSGLTIELPRLESGDDPQLLVPVIYAGVMGWSRIHGMILLELFGHAQPIVSDTDLFYQHEINLMLHSFGLQPGE